MLKRIVVCWMIALVAGCATSKPNLPAESDGLRLMPDTKLATIYMKPGADLSQYDKIALLDTYVAFAKNWERNYNEEATFEDRVSDKDMQKIRQRVASEFNREMTKVLTKDGREMVSKGGTGVLILRPAIINLRVTAPDLMTAGMEQTYVASAGSMTLFMELLDGKTGALIAKVIDTEAADNTGMMQVADSVTNMADFDRIVRRWAGILNSHLAKITTK
ncbi:MAG: DUF3313 family protein [Halioglobus sp.]|nr:DUF3313 family protein [Halioglobus sp.]